MLVAQPRHKMEDGRWEMEDRDRDRDGLVHACVPFLG